jgi:DNA polymerase III subunit gamma/tau
MMRRAESQPQVRPEIRVASIADILALADQHRDIQFKIFVKQYVRPVSFGDGRLEIALEAGAPKSLYNDISRRLETWTGRRWLVVPSNDQGAPTEAENEAGTKRAAVDAAMDDPAVAAIMRRMPGTKIIGVTLRGQKPEPIFAEQPSHARQGWGANQHNDVPASGDPIIDEGYVENPDDMLSDE